MHSLRLQTMVKHDFLLQQFMTTMLVPILKNKNGDIASKSNYRPIALSTVASKIWEIILVNHVEEYIVRTENQFAYKKSHSTDICIFTLKECIRYYTVHNTPIYVCDLDASKVFDCINYWKLFKILVDRKCPVYVIKVLVYWYQEQRLCVKWDGMASDTFSVCNGIKQGGILSPKLFNIYVDVLSQRSNTVMAWCCMNGKVINHLYYADELVLLSPSTHGMQKLLDECETYASKYGMKFNENKSVVLNFKGCRFKAQIIRLVQYIFRISHAILKLYIDRFYGLEKTNSHFLPNILTCWQPYETSLCFYWFYSTVKTLFGPLFFNCWFQHHALIQKPWWMI